MKDVRKKLRRDAVAVVADGQTHMQGTWGRCGLDLSALGRAVEALEAQADAAAARRKLDAVHEQVPNHLPQAIGIAAHETTRVV